MEMRRHKKLIIAGVLVGVLLLGSIGGVVLAQEQENEEGSTICDRVAAILQDEGDVAQVERLDPGDEVLDVGAQGVLPNLGRLALAEAHVVRNEYAVALGQRREDRAPHVAVEVAGVQEDQGAAGAMVVVGEESVRKL